MIRRTWIVGAAAFCLMLGGRAEAWQMPSAKSAAKAESHAVSISDEDNGKDVDLTSGGTLIVRLKSNPSTGYRWAVAGDPSPLKLEKTSYRKNTASSKAVGAPGVQVFQFDARSAGMASLQIIYRRSWEYNVAPVKTFGVRVKVR
ncbi:MAG: protease inhibitor I42 family protein [Candidatus Korobacteraceae bacterium]